MGSIDLDVEVNDMVNCERVKSHVYLAVLYSSDSAVLL